MADEPALTDDWFQKPYDELVAQARKVGAFVGPSAHTTRWSPDTCPCVIDQIADGVIIRGIDSRDNIREIFVHDPAADMRCETVPTRCRFHPTPGTAQQHFDIVLTENQLKNFFQKAIIEDVPLTKDLPYIWSFDIDRKLVVDVRGKEALTVEAIKALGLRSEFIGKVIFLG